MELPCLRWAISRYSYTCNAASDAAGITPMPPRQPPAHY